MNTKEFISFDEINLNELEGLKKEVVAEILFDKSRLSRGLFKAGIRTNIKFESMIMNEQYDSLDLVFRDKETNALNYSRVYPTSEKYYKGNEKAHHRAYMNKIRLVYSLLNTATYPEIYNQSLIDTDEWSVFIREVADLFNKNKGNKDLLIAGVWVVNRNGYVQLRQSFRTNLCTMKELDKNVLKPEEFFHIDEKFDNFELPEVDGDDKNISPISGVKYKTFPKDHPIYNNGKDIKLEEEEE